MSTLDQILANIDTTPAEDAPKFAKGDHVVTRTGKVHLVGGAWGAVSYSPCATGSGINSGTLTDAPVDCKTCAKHAARLAN